MERRQFMIGTAILGLAATAEAKPSAPPPAAPAAPPPAPDPREAVLAALAECEAKGLGCVDHCARELAAGNTDMAECSAAVAQMLAVSRAQRELVARHATLAPRLAAVCAEACDTCAAACKKHEEHFAHGMHLECKACLEACVACATACRAFAA